MRSHPMQPLVGLLLLGSSACAAESASVDDGAPLAQTSTGASDVVPVLAFRARGTLFLAKVSVTGTFPSVFRLSPPATPPPPGAVAVDPGLPGVPAFALASVAALPSDHPAQLQTSARTASSRCDIGDDDASPERSACFDVVEACTPDRSSCGKLELTCDGYRENCTVTGVEGDTALLNSISKRVPGHSRDYGLVYLTQAASAGSFLSQYVGRGAALAAGYHLVQKLYPAKAELEALDRCLSDARPATDKLLSEKWGKTFDNVLDYVDHYVVTKYNQKHGTAHTSISELAPGHELDALSDEADASYDAAFFEVVVSLQCLMKATFLSPFDGFERDLTIAIREPAPRPHVGDKFARSPAWEASDALAEWF